MILLYCYSLGMVFTAGTFLETLVRLKRGQLVAHSPVVLFGAMFLVLLFWPYLVYRMFTQDDSEEDHSWLISEPIRPIFFKDDEEYDFEDDFVRKDLCLHCSKVTEVDHFCSVCENSYEAPPYKAEYIDIEELIESNRKLAADFDAAWKNMERRGYRYGEEELSNVRVGWDMAQAEITKRDALIAELSKEKE